MKLTKGSLKVVVFDPHAIIENPKRVRAGGKRFVPPYIVFERNEETATYDTHYAFAVHGRGLRALYNHTIFPHAKWLPTKFKDIRVWIETTDELTLVINYEDTNV